MFRKLLKFLNRPSTFAFVVPAVALLLVGDGIVRQISRLVGWIHGWL